MVERNPESSQPEKQYPEVIREDAAMKGLFDSGVALAVIAFNGLRGTEKPGHNMDLALVNVTGAALVLASNYPEIGDDQLLDEGSLFERSTEFWRKQMLSEAERRGLLLTQPVQRPVFSRRSIWRRRRRQ